MHLHELQQQIVNDKLNKFYIFTGDEVGIMDVYIEKMIKVGGYTVNRIDTVQEAIGKITQRRMTKSKRCWIVLDDKQYLKEDKNWDIVEAGCSSSEDMLILKYTNLDKRSKFYKKYKNTAAVFDKLDTSILAKYIQQEISLSNTNAKLLAEMCENDYSRCMLECDKIQQYLDSKVERRITDIDEAFKQLKIQGVINQPIGDITFQFTDAIATRDIQNTSILLAQARNKGEPEIMVLSILYNTFKQILLVQGLGRERTNATARTGLTSWQVNMASNKMNYYSIPELVKGLKLIRFVEKGIKTSQIDASIALDYLIVNLF